MQLNIWLKRVGWFPHQTFTGRDVLSSSNGKFHLPRQRIPAVEGFGWAEDIAQLDLHGQRCGYLRKLQKLFVSGLPG